MRQMLMGTGATVRPAAAAAPKGELRAGACLLEAPSAAIGDEDVAQDLAASTITLYPSDTAERRIGRLIAVSSDYICYAVKGVLLRPHPTSRCRPPSPLPAPPSLECTTQWKILTGWCVHSWAHSRPVSPLAGPRALAWAHGQRGGSAVLQRRRVLTRICRQRRCDHLLEDREKHA